MSENAKVHLYPDERMDTKNASKYLGLAVKTLAMMRSNGIGPDYVKRGRIFYFKGDLDKWLQEGKTHGRCEGAQNT